MSITSESHLAILVTAFEISAGGLPAGSHAISPKMDTRYSIFACRVDKSSMKLDDRGVLRLFRDSPDLRISITARTWNFLPLDDAPNRSATGGNELEQVPDNRAATNGRNAADFESFVADFVDHDAEHCGEACDFR